MKTTVFAALLCLVAGIAQAACREDVVELRGDFGQARFTVEIADEPREISRGLMFRESMPMGQGMLFLYEEPRRATFWMRNTLIPLDMIFVDETGRISHIHENAIPLDETTIDGGTGVLAVLEINAGLSAQIGFTVGDEMRHPSFNREIAVWPCE